ncbi:LmbU family transcriptional regulator [Streptomyces sp. NPDC087300]|uniref:LmbU family transcriptional regulator n=1 Tax=Streptomyces sp. NPDC087300 TaxID=3365780 RepID=UPI003821A5D4
MTGNRAAGHRTRGRNGPPRNPVVPTALEGQVFTERTSLALPTGLPLESWRQVGQRLTRLNDSSQWWLGDWLVYGQDRYPERYRRAVSDTCLDYQTLRNYAWIARKFPAHRRRAALSVQHHIEVAGLPEAAQETWLDAAERDGWSRNELRRTLKGIRGADGEPPPGEQVFIRFHATSEQRLRWAESARLAERRLDEWILHVLDSAAPPPHPKSPRPDAPNPQGDASS